VDAKKLAVRDRKRNCSGVTRASAQRLRVEEVCRAPRVSRRAADRIESRSFRAVSFV